jgi:hypothetical protein
MCRDLVGSTTEGQARAGAIEPTIEETFIAKYNRKKIAEDRSDKSFSAVLPFFP